MKTWKKVAVGAAAASAIGLTATTIVVERESEYRLELMSPLGRPKALVLYHPSRDARFSDDLSAAVAEGFDQAGFTVERATMTGSTPDRPVGYEVIAVISNTYYWTPDRPTLRYLRRADLRGTPVIGLIGGAGATARSERMLDQALRRTGGAVVDTRSYWLLRPNDESRLGEDNRAVALDLATTFARAVGHSIAPWH